MVNPKFRPKYLGKTINNSVHKIPARIPNPPPLHAISTQLDERHEFITLHNPLVQRPIPIETRPLKTRPSIPKYLLSASLISEMRHLRYSDPEKWTVNKLRRKFRCNGLLVEMFTKLKERDLFLSGNLDEKFVSRYISRLSRERGLPILNSVEEIDDFLQREQICD